MIEKNQNDLIKEIIKKLPQTEEIITTAQILINRNFDEISNIMIDPYKKLLPDRNHDLELQKFKEALQINGFKSPKEQDQLYNFARLLIIELIKQGLSPK